MATQWLHKVRTGSGSDRVVSETLDYAGHHKSLALFGENEMIAPAFRPGRSRGKDCVETRNVTIWPT